MTRLTATTLRLLARVQTRAEAGASMAEYGLLLALISVVALAALGSVGQKVSATFTQVAGAL